MADFTSADTEDVENQLKIVGSNLIESFGPHSILLANKRKTNRARFIKKHFNTKHCNIKQ